MTMFAKRLVAISLFIAVAFLSKPSTAAEDPGCIANFVGYFKGTQPNLFVACSSGSAYWAYIGTNVVPSGCTGQVSGTLTVDDIKLWESIAASGFLSGRTLDITYTTGIAGCTTRGFITSVSLKQ